MIVYLDMLFMINFIIDYILAYSTSKATYFFTSKKRLVLSSLAGGIYSVFMFEKKLSMLYSPPFKILFSFIIIFIAFKIKNIKGFLRILANYYTIAFAVCGTAIFINYFFGVVKMKDGLFYFANNSYLLIPAAVISCVIIVYALKIINKNNIKDRNKIRVEIYMENKSATVTGITDTGNMLLDPITLYPVIVVDYNSISSILPEGIYEFIKAENDLNTVISRKYINKIRLIPYSSVGVSSVLKGFKPDLVIIRDKEDKILKDVIIAVSYKNLSENNEFSAIFNPQF